MKTRRAVSIRRPYFFLQWRGLLRGLRGLSCRKIELDNKLLLFPNGLTMSVRKNKDGSLLKFTQLLFVVTFVANSSTKAVALENR